MTDTYVARAIVTVTGLIPMAVAWLILAKHQRLYGYNDRGLADAERTRVQLRLLRDQGWTVAALAREVGCNRQTIRWTLREDRRVSARIRVAVDRLCHADTLSA